MPWKPEFSSDLDQNLLKPFPHPNDASDIISFKSADWLQRYSCLKVLTDGRTDAGSTGIYHELTLCAFGSGELKMRNYLKSMFKVLENCLHGFQLGQT